MTRILGIAASLRNARWAAGNQQLIQEIEACATEDELKAYLKRQADLHLQQFVDAGRAEGQSFDHIYRELRRLSGDRGLSNSEVALAAGLWAARHAGCEIDHVSLAEHFPAAGASRRLDELKQRLLAADGILLSGPVYFGDRGSLAQDLIDLIRDDAELRSGLQQKVYAGIAVGAKRNGGQETTLIYQLLDLVDAGLVGVGNDSDTTSQYGGTGHAGDVGTMPADQYGLWTSMGTGRRIARVAGLMRSGAQAAFDSRLRLQFWILQDKDQVAASQVRRLAAACADRVDASIVDLTAGHVTRCIACDICPTHVDIDLKYRCIIPAGGKDLVGPLHEQFLNQDAIVPVHYSPANRGRLASNYQRFIERTRYLRRGDYVFSDLLVAPLVFKDLGVEENMHVRMLTSMIRHHTVVSRPMIGHFHNGGLLQGEALSRELDGFIDTARTLCGGRLLASVEQEAASATKYNPIGYVLSTEKDREDEKLRLRRNMVQERSERQLRDALDRLPRLRKRAA
jgi:multimeric flavodoxin WrbA